MPNKNKERIPFQIAPRRQLIEENRRVLREYEQRYEMSSARMAQLVDQDAITPDTEVIKWYHIYDELQFLLATTPTTGIRGTTTETFTTAD